MRSCGCKTWSFVKHGGERNRRTTAQICNILPPPLAATPFPAVAVVFYQTHYLWALSSATLHDTAGLCHQPNLHGSASPLVRPTGRNAVMRWTLDCRGGRACAHLCTLATLPWRAHPLAAHRGCAMLCDPEPSGLVSRHTHCPWRAPSELEPTDGEARHRRNGALNQLQPRTGNAGPSRTPLEQDLDGLAQRGAERGKLGQRTDGGCTDSRRLKNHPEASAGMSQREGHTAVASSYKEPTLIQSKTAALLPTLFWTRGYVPFSPAPGPSRVEQGGGGVSEGGFWYVAWVYCSRLRLAAPIGQSPSAALPFDPFPPSAAVPISRSLPCALPLPPCPILPSLLHLAFPFAFPSVGGGARRC